MAKNSRRYSTHHELALRHFSAEIPDKNRPFALPLWLDAREACCPIDCGRRDRHSACCLAKRHPIDQCDARLKVRSLPGMSIGGCLPKCESTDCACADVGKVMKQYPDVVLAPLIILTFVWTD